MTVASTTNRKSFSGDGVTTSFGTSPVVFYESTDLVVQVFSAAGVATTLTEGTQYTVSGGSATGATGTVNLAGGSAPYGAPAGGTTLLIRRILPLVQEADFLNNDINDAEVSETALDKLTMIAQQINETSGRGVAIPAVETATDALIVLPFDRASKYLAFDANKEMIASPGPAGDNVPVSTFMETVLDDTSAADARTTLGAAASGAVTASGLTMATARLLGRTTASAGAVEEISVGASLTLSGGSLSVTTPVAAPGPVTNSLSGNVSLNNTSNFFDGPSVAQGTTGTWFVSGTVTLNDSGGAATFYCKLWDGTTVIASCVARSIAANNRTNASLSGYITSPAGNLRISVKDISATTGLIENNTSGEGKDSAITAYRIS